MPVEKELAGSRSDENFRKGACHGANWFLYTSQTLAQEGRSAAEIVEHLAALEAVLKLWRTQTCDLPDGNPWDWSLKDLSRVIHDMNTP